MDTSCRNVSGHYNHILREYGSLHCIRIRLCREASAINNLKHDSSSALYRILGVLIISDYIRPPGGIWTI